MTTASNDNAVAIQIPLSGSLGTGKTLTVDAEDVETVAALGPWGLVTNGAGRAYVRSTRRALRASAGQPSGSGLVSLSRYLTGAKRGQRVFFRDGNPLNLTRGNMLVPTRTKAA